MSVPNIPKYETERLMAESFYGYYPHSKKINNAIWDFYGSQEYLWLSEIKKMSKKIKVDVATLLIYVQLLATEDNYTPSLLKQNFYQLNKEGQLMLIRLSMKKVLSKCKTNPTKKPEEAFIDWAKSVFCCWQVIKNEEKPVLLLDASFTSPSNSLWNILENW